MALWGNVDNAANSTIFAAAQVHKTPNSTNRTSLFDNTTTDAFITNQKVGQFGASTDEIEAINSSLTDVGEHPAHAGWSLRTVGTGGRAGRVHYETLVAMGSLSGDASDDTQLKDFTILFTLQPTANVVNTTLSQAAVFKAAVGTVPAGKSVTYQWQSNGTNITTGGTWGNSGYSTSNTLTIATPDVATANLHNFRVVVSGTGATTVYSANVKLTALV